MKRFDNRTVIVTGGARRLGASNARGFIEEGADYAECVSPDECALSPENIAVLN